MPWGDLLEVFRIADNGAKILETRIPRELHEAQPDKIVSAYLNYIKDHDKFDTVSIEERFGANEYDAFYQVFHDIKVACASIIQKYRVGTPQYKDVDFFYKFTTELILREASRLGIHLGATKNSRKSASKEPDSVTDFEAQVCEDFATILRQYTTDHGEVIYHVHKTVDPPSPLQQLYASVLYPSHQEKPQRERRQPLFTSLTGKSSVDPRATIVPDPYQLAEVVPKTQLGSHEPLTLSSLSPHVPKVSAPPNQPTDMMSNFFHPNWYTLAVPTWLKYQTSAVRPEEDVSFARRNGEVETKTLSSFVTSFAPILDLKTSIISQRFKANIWFEHIGYKEISDIRRRYMQKLSGETDAMEVEPDLKDKTKEATEDAASTRDEPKAEVMDAQLSAPEEGDESKIDLNDVVSWDPSNIAVLKNLKRDKATIAKSVSLFQRLISLSLLKLNKLRQQRYIQAILQPTTAEIKLYEKTKRLITLFIKLNNVTPDKLSIEFSRRLPVLMNEYAGTLPGSAMMFKPMHSTTAKNPRLPSIRGPYKKKNRII